MIFGPKKLSIEPGKPEKNWLRMMVFELATEFAFLIAAPLLVLGYFGNKLSIKYGSKLYILAAILLALTISTVALGKRINFIRKNLK